MYEYCFPDVDIWETLYNFRFWVFIPFEAKSICSETRGCRKRFIPAGTGSKIWGIQSQNTGWHRAQGKRYIYRMLFVILSYFFNKTRFNEITSGVNCWKFQRTQQSTRMNKAQIMQWCCKQTFFFRSIPRRSMWRSPEPREWPLPWGCTTTWPITATVRSHGEGDRWPFLALYPEWRGAVSMSQQMISECVMFNGVASLHTFYGIPSFVD